MKERDPLFEIVLKWITHSEWDMTLSMREALARAETLIDQHYENPDGSELSRKCPAIAHFYTRLPLLKGLDNLSSRVAVEERRFVPPTVSEIRQVFNLAQIYAMVGKVSLLTFDADDTIYEHGMDLEADSWIVDALLTLMQQGIVVAVVTAAGYPGKPERYAARFRGLLDRMREIKAPKEVTDRFLCLGGECNYLFRVDPEGYGMVEVDDTLWVTPEMRSWADADVKRMLDIAEAALTENAARLRLDVQMMRKSRAVGLFPRHAEDRIAYEALEDVALAVQDALVTADVHLPYCAFNGNRDVWVDVGDKRHGILALQSFLGLAAEATCHMGDRMTNTGNDKRARDVAMTVWVTNPDETCDYLELLLSEMGTEAAKACAAARPRGAKKGTLEWHKAQVVQRNTSA